MGWLELRFKEATYAQTCLDALKKPTNIGKRYETIKPACKYDAKFKGGRPYPQEFVTDRVIKIPRESGLAAIEEGAGFVERRIRLAAYLEDFAGAFSEENFLQRFLTSLFQDEIAKADLFTLMQQYHQEGWSADAEDERKRRRNEQYDRLEDFLYDVDGTYELLTARARSLLARVGFLKAA